MPLINTALSTLECLDVSQKIKFTYHLLMEEKPPSSAEVTYVGYSAEANLLQEEFDSRFEKGLTVAT